MISRTEDTFAVVRRRHRMLAKIGWAAAIIGLLLASWVGYDWFYHSVSHEVVAWVAGILVLLGVQLLVFSNVAHMLILLQEEQRIYLEGED